jgi:hypothetical protein
MYSANWHVGFTPESDIKCDKWKCPLWANSGHRAIFPSHRRPRPTPLEDELGCCDQGTPNSNNAREGNN